MSQTTGIEPAARPHLEDIQRRSSVIRSAVAIFAFSLVIRVVWASFAHVTPLSDFAFYDGLARNLLNTGTYQYLGKQAWIPPGYPLFLAGIYAVFGKSALACGMAQAILGGLSSGLIVLLGARVFSRRAAVTGGLIHAVAPVMIAYVPALASENLAIPLMLGMLLAVDAARQHQGRAGQLLAALAGLLCGLLLLTRTAMLFTVPVCMALLVSSFRARTWSITRPLAFLAALCLAMMPWVARNYHVGMGFMPLTSVGGAGLCIANSDRCLNGEWGDVSFAFTQGMSEKDSARACNQFARRWIQQNQARYLALCRVRLTRLLGAEADEWAARLLTPTRSNDDTIVAYFTTAWEGNAADPELLARARALQTRNMQFLYWANVLFFSPLALTALVLALSRWRDSAILILPLAFYMGGLSLTIASMRYRLMSDPILYILIAALLCDLTTGSQELGRRPGRLAKIGLCVLVILTSLTVHATGFADQYYRLPQMPVRSPDVSNLRFSDVDLNLAGPTWVCRTQTSISRQEDGLHCSISGTEDTSAAQYGGLSFPADRCEAARLEFSLLNPQQIVHVFVDFTDAAGNRIARWMWDAQAGVARRERRGTYVFLPGQPVGRFAAEPSPGQALPAAVHVFLQVAPRAQAGIILHRAEVGRKPEVSALHFSAADLLQAAPSWVCRTQTRISRQNDGLHCSVSGTTDTSAAQYGGFMFAADACEAVRLELSAIHPENILRVFVDLTDAGGDRLARWQGDVSSENAALQRRGTYLFAPGRAVSWFTAEETPHRKAAALVHVFIEVSPRTEAGIILHKAEIGRVSAAGSRPSN